MKRWFFRACRKDVDDSEWRKLCGSSFQVVGAVKEKDLWPKVLVKTHDLDRIRESVDERRGRGGVFKTCLKRHEHVCHNMQ